jgi:hypothetical protein
MVVVSLPLKLYFKRADLRLSELRQINNNLPLQKQSQMTKAAHRKIQSFFRRLLQVRRWTTLYLLKGN